MASAVKAFMDTVMSATGRVPVWLPGLNVELGDIGVFEDGQWTQKSTLKDEGIPFRVREDDTPSEGLDLANGENWEVSGGVTGDVKVPGGPSGHGVLKLSLSGSGSFVLRTSDSIVNTISNLNEVEGEMLHRFRTGNGDWDKSWFVVNEIFVPSRAFVAVANGRAASLNLDLGVQPSGAVLDLAEATVGARIGETSNVSGKLLALTPAALTFNVRRADWGGTEGFKNVVRPVVIREVDIDKDMNWNGNSQAASQDA